MTTHEKAVSILPPGKLACGLVLPGVAQSHLVAEARESGAGPADIVRVAKACERAGFFYVAVGDHIAIPRSKAAAMSTVWYDPVATFGFLAAATERVRLLSYVYVLPYRHPLATAKSFATIGRLSAGRVILGVGAGHLEDEFVALGVPFRGRGRQLDEAIEVVQLALANEYAMHHGPGWSFDDVAIAPRPVQVPRPPIWVGGSTDAALRRAAAHGDGWLPQGVPAIGLPAAIERIRRLRRELAATSRSRSAPTPSASTSASLDSTPARTCGAGQVPRSRSRFAHSADSASAISAFTSARAPATSSSSRSIASPAR